MSTDTIVTAELDSTIKAKIKKIESGFKHIFKVSKSIVKKSNEVTDQDQNSLSAEEQSVAQQMSAKMLDYFNKTKSASTVKKAELDIGNFSEGSSDKMKSVEEWIKGVKEKLDSSGSNLDRGKIFNKVMEDIKTKSPEAYDFYFSNNKGTETESSENNLFSNDSEQPKKDHSKELNINENKLFSGIDIANIKIAMPQPEEVQESNSRVFLQDNVIEFIIAAYKSFLSNSEMRSKIRFPKSVVEYIKRQTQQSALNGVISSASNGYMNFISKSDNPAQLHSSIITHIDTYAEEAKVYLYDDLLGSVSENIYEFVQNKEPEVKATMVEVAKYFITLIHTHTKKPATKAIQNALNSIFNKFAQLTTRITGGYDLEDIVAAMLVGGEKDKFFHQVYSYIVNSMESNTRIASDVMDKIVDDAFNDEDLLRKYFKAYTEGVECLLTDFVNQSGIPADTMASVLRNNYISDDTLAKMSEGINNFVERGATLEEQRAVKQFIDQYQISPELAYKLVRTSSKSEFIRMSAAVLIKHTFANVDEGDYKYISEDVDVVKSVLGHLNTEIQKLDPKYAVSGMEIDKYGTINITIVDEGGNEKQVSNKDEDFDLDLEDKSDNQEDSADESGDQESDLNAEIDKAVQETASGLSGEGDEGSVTGDVFTGSNDDTQETDMSNSVFNTDNTGTETEMGSEPTQSEQPSVETENQESNRLKQLFV